MVRMSRIMEDGSIQDLGRKEGNWANLCPQWYPEKIFPKFHSSVVFTYS
jgi:hypothetical protein